MFDRLTLTTIIHPAGVNMLVFSKLFYCSSAWSNAADTNLLKLQAVQNFADQIICASRKFENLNLLRFWKNYIGYLLNIISAIPPWRRACF